MLSRYAMIGRRIRSLRQSHDETQADLARLLGYTQAAIADYERARVRISVEDLEKLADHYGVSVTYFLDRENDMERIQARLRQAVKELNNTEATLQEVIPYSGKWVWLPLIGEVPAGYPDWQEEREPEGFYPCAANAVRDPEKAYGLRVCGDSMDGRGILDRDIVFVDTIRPPRSGDMVVARRDDVVVLRIYIEQPGGPYLKAANDDYPLYKLVEGRIMGVVVGSYRENP